MRGVAILLVVFHHFGVIADFPGPHRIAVGRFLERAFYAGWAGVDLFFVLSGFLITSILLASRNDADYFKTFYSRRALRIFPLYFGTLLLGLVILPILRPLPPEFAGQSNEHALWLWTYTSNIAYAIGAVATFGVFDIYWSLAIEEQFYGIWPWLVRFARPVMLALVCAGVVVARACPASVLARAWRRMGKNLSLYADAAGRTGDRRAGGVGRPPCPRALDDGVDRPRRLRSCGRGAGLRCSCSSTRSIRARRSCRSTARRCWPCALAADCSSSRPIPPAVWRQRSPRLGFELGDASATESTSGIGRCVWQWRDLARPAGRDGIRRALPAGRNLHDRRTGWFGTGSRG